MTTMAALDAKFAQRVNETLQIASSTEALWLTAPPASVVRRQLRASQLEALYESVYLRIFSAWESFIEDVVVRFMSGRVTPGYRPVRVSSCPRLSSVTAARAHLYKNRDYLLWHNPVTSANRISGYISASPVELVLRSQQLRLQAFADIRHRIAHDSDDSKTKFSAAALMIAGSDYNGKPGKLLRATDISDPLNQPKWIRVISFELINIAQSILI
jgi:hypothetical protein